MLTSITGEEFYSIIIDNVKYRLFFMTWPEYVKDLRGSYTTVEIDALERRGWTGNIYLYRTNGEKLDMSMDIVAAIEIYVTNNGFADLTIEEYLERVTTTHADK